MDRYFPLFIKSGDVRFLVVGGGKIALRRVNTLLKFDFSIRIVSPSLCTGLEKLAGSGKIEYIKDIYRKEYLSGCQLATACTDRRDVNREAGRDCREAGIPVSVCDCRDECTFYFPAIAACDDVVCGIAGGEDHGKTRRIASEIREIVEVEK